MVVDEESDCAPAQDLEGPPDHESRGRCQDEEQRRAKQGASLCRLQASPESLESNPGDAKRSIERAHGVVEADNRSNPRLGLDHLHLHPPLRDGWCVD